MKKKIFMFLLLASILLPMTVKADLNPLKGDIYAEEAAVNSKVVFSIQRSVNGNLKGTLTFDSNVLEVVEVREKNIGFNDTYAGNSVLKKTVDVGKVTIDYTAGDEANIAIEVVFKVKSTPSNGKTTLKFTPEANSWENSIEKSISILAEKTCPTCEKDEVSCPVCETCEECETTAGVSNETTESEKTNSKDLLLYGALGGCGVLAIAVILLAARKN